MPCDAKLVLAVLVLEACTGYPRWLFAAIGHPVTWIGRLLGALERAWNQPRFSESTRRALGIVTVVIAVGLAAGVAGVAVDFAARATAVAVDLATRAGLAIERIVAGAGPEPVASFNWGTVWGGTLEHSTAPLVPSVPFDYGSVLIALIATAGLAQRSLYEHLRAVQTALKSGNLDSARTAVGNIVGRDTTALSAAEVSAAAIESLAESFNDAVVAPAFWLFVGGLPGLFAYKALNTADSMIGHIEPRWRAFGWASARLDDVANFVPARIAGVLIALAGAGANGSANASAGGGASIDVHASASASDDVSINARASASAGAHASGSTGSRGSAPRSVLSALRIMWRDAPKHASPNAGWPEAAAAGALGIRLGGPTFYDGVMHARPHFGDGASPQAPDLARALRLYRRSCAGLWLLVAAIGTAITIVVAVAQSPT
jgi:adenosylcobinamide-phosphate synthase